MRAKDFIERYGIEPNPKLDQHFMTDESIIDKIVSSAEINENDIVVEIGAGLGAVSRKISLCKKLILIELDERLAEILEKKFSGEIKEKKIVVINENALNVLESLKFSKIISNLPYSICEPVFYKLFEKKFDLAVFAVPANFYKKLQTVNTTFTLLANSFYAFEKVCDAGRNAFYPAPEADSVIVRISPKTPLVDSFIVQQLYFQKDKKVKNAVREILISLYGVTKRVAKAQQEKFFFDEEFLNKDISTLLFNEYMQLVEKIKNAENTA